MKTFYSVLCSFLIVGSVFAQGVNSQKLKILGSGEIKDKVSIEADLISKSAITKLEKAGGTIQLKK